MGFFKKIKKLITNQWETVDFVKGNYTVDNTKTDFYKRNGFLEYDGMSKETVFWCTYKIQKHKETGEYRIKHDGYEDEELLRKAHKIKRKLQFEDSKETIANLFEQNRIAVIKKNYLPK